MYWNNGMGFNDKLFRKKIMSSFIMYIEQLNTIGITMNRLSDHMLIDILNIPFNEKNLTEMVSVYLCGNL